MAVNYSKLAVGDIVSTRRYVLDADTVSRYRDAVGDRSQVASGDDGGVFVPPMAIAALSLRGVVTDLAIPGGTLHVGQEMEFTRAVTAGEAVECDATLAQNSVRGEWRFMVVQVEVRNEDGQKVMRGKSTIMLPVDG